MAGLDSIMQATKFLPASVAVKALQKFNPKFKNYFANAAAYGYDVNHALDYLNQRFSSEHSEPFERKLEQKAASGQARPDELIARKEIQQGKMPGKIARSAAAIGAGALLGGVPGAVAGAAAEAIPKEQGLEHVPGLGQFKGEHGPQEQSPREKALRRHAEMNKKKKMIDQLTEDFEKEYGQGNVPTAGLSGASQGSASGEKSEQATPGADKSEVLRALLKANQILGG